MMYLVNTLVVGATAVELRNLKVDATGEKILLNAHGLAENDILYSGDTAVGGVDAKTAYRVSSPDTDSFQLKDVKAGERLVATGTAKNLSDAFVGNTLQKYGSKMCSIKSGNGSNLTGSDGGANVADGMKCSEAGFTRVDELLIYCESTAGNACDLDGAKAAGGTVNAKLAHGTSVWIASETLADDTTTLSANSFQLANAKGGSANTITFAGNMTADGSNKIWLLKKDTTVIYPTRPAKGNSWDTTGNKGIMNGAAFGSSTVFGADLDMYWYTAGNPPTCAAKTAECGLESGKVYSVNAVPNEPWAFKLKGVKAHTDHTLTADDTAAIKVDNAAGKGDSFSKVENGRQITGSTKTANTITVKGDNSAGNAKYLVTDDASNKLRLKFYCMSATETDCDYKIAGMKNGSTYKIKTVADNGTDDTAITLTAVDGTEVLAVTENTTGKTKGYAFTQKSDAGAVTLGPASDPTTTSKATTKAAAGNSGSAARSFAMLGSAVAMATAFLLA